MVPVPVHSGAFQHTPTRKSDTTMRTITGYAAAAVLAGMLMTGCSALGIGEADGGGDSGASAGGGQAASKQDEQDAMVEFAECMRDNGVDIPDPKDGKLVVPGRSVDGAGKEDKALKECEELLPVDEDAPSAEEQYESDLKLAECLRGEGIDIDDPKEGEGLMLPTGDDDVQKAVGKCSGETGSGMGTTKKEGE